LSARIHEVDANNGAPLPEVAVSFALPLLVLALAAPPASSTEADHPPASDLVPASTAALPAPDPQANRFLVGAIAGGVGCVSVPMLGGLGLVGGALALCPGALLSGGVGALAAAVALAVADVPLDSAAFLPVGVAAGIGVVAALGAAVAGLVVALPLAVVFGPAAIVPILLAWGAIGTGAGVLAAVGGGVATALLAPPPRKSAPATP
jgi:hypothetical protein